MIEEAASKEYGGNTQAEWIEMARKYPANFIRRAHVALSGVTEPWVDESYEIAIPQVPATSFGLANTFVGRGERMINALKKAANIYAGAGPALEFFPVYGLYGEVEKTGLHETAGTETIRWDAGANRMLPEQVEKAVQDSIAYYRGKALEDASKIQNEQERAMAIAAVNKRNWGELATTMRAKQREVNEREAQIYPWALEIAEIAAAKVPHLIQESPDMISALPNTKATK